MPRRRPAAPRDDKSATPGIVRGSTISRARKRAEWAPASPRRSTALFHVGGIRMTDAADYFRQPADRWRGTSPAIFAAHARGQGRLLR